MISNSHDFGAGIAYFHYSQSSGQKEESQFQFPCSLIWTGGQYSRRTIHLHRRYLKNVANRFWTRLSHISVPSKIRFIGRAQPMFFETIQQSTFLFGFVSLCVQVYQMGIFPTFGLCNLIFLNRDLWGYFFKLFWRKYPELRSMVSLLSAYEKKVYRADGRSGGTLNNFPFPDLNTKRDA